MSRAARNRTSSAFAASSQPFFTAEVFTGKTGRYVKLADTIKGFREIADGKCDEIPESAFFYVGTIEEAVENATKAA